MPSSFLPAVTAADANPWAALFWIVVIAITAWQLTRRTAR
jgi:hypothetical protein